MARPSHAARGATGRWQSNQSLRCRLQPNEHPAAGSQRVRRVQRHRDRALTLEAAASGWRPAVRPCMRSRTEVLAHPRPKTQRQFACTQRQQSQMTEGTERLTVPH